MKGLLWREERKKKMGLRVRFAVWASNLTAAVTRKLGGQGLTLSGNVAELLCPHILEELSAQVREKVIVVCGTNGKTTTTNMIAAALAAEGKKVICNHTGANMPNGIASAFVQAADYRGQIDADIAVLEVDEGYARAIFPQVKPSLMVLTNLFRDQLDRYGEIDITMDLLEKAIRSAEGLQILANGDDVLSTYLAMDSGKPYKTYGISQPVQAGAVNEIREGQFCKRCGTKLEYAFYHFSQLGDYRCPGCGLKRPALTFDAQRVDLRDPMSFDAVYEGQAEHLSTSYRGFYNLYNILSAYGVVRLCGLSGEHFEEMLHSFHPENGRMEPFLVQGTRVTLNLAKNPAGFNQNIATLLQDESPKDLIIAIHDKEQDGRDISWLWDVDFDALAAESVRSIRVTGIRALDMCLRLKYVDIPSQVVPDMETAIREVTEGGQGTGNLYVLVNYSALYGTHSILEKLSKEGKP